MNKDLKYWLRWFAVLPTSVLAGFLATFLLHLILYLTLTVSGIVAPYPELPERLLTPFVFFLAFVWSGPWVAPDYKYNTTLALFCLILLGLRLSIMVSPSVVRWLGSSGLGLILAVAGACVALYLWQKKTESARDRPLLPGHRQLQLGSANRPADAGRDKLIKGQRKRI
jgi:hypothetical protein